MDVQAIILVAVEVNVLALDIIDMRWRLRLGQWCGCQLIIHIDIVF